MEKTYHLALDLGATSGRSVLATYDGKQVEMQELTRFHYPMLPISGHLFWNLPLIYQEVLGAMRAAAKQLSETGDTLSSIGIDTWGCDVAYFYADGTLAGLPYCYRDTHTEGAVGKFTSTKMPHAELYDRTGIQFMDFNTLFQLHTLRTDGAKVLDAADKILFMPDALVYMLTDKAVTEFTVASTSQMLNLSTGDFDKDLLDSLGLSRDKFGPIVQPGAEIGTITPEIQHATGLGEVKVIAVAGHDTASAVIGIPTHDDKYAYLSCGTWALLGVESQKSNSGEKALEYNFTNEGGIDGTTRLLKNICGLWMFERVRAELGLQDMDISTLAASCMDSVCETLVNPDDPSFANPKSMVEAIKAYCEANSLEAPKSTADHVRVIYRSLAHRVGKVLDWLKELSPVAPERLHVIGGGSRNTHLMQMLADSTRMPVVAGPAECTALGNVLVQLRGCGNAPSLKHMRDIAINSTEVKTYHPAGEGK